MAKIVIDLPRDSEVKSIKYDPDKRQLVIEPRFRRNAMVPVLGYLSAESTAGNKIQATLNFSGNTGDFLITREAAECPSKFDEAGFRRTRPERKKPPAGSVATTTSERP